MARADEIKTLVENQNSMVDTIAEKQESQMRSQDNRNNVEPDKIPIGAIVYIESKYHGPYKVSGYTRLGNYNLETLKQIPLKQSYPRELLKLVITDKSLITIEKIVKRRKRKGVLEYLVSYTDENADDEWLKAGDFDSAELIEQFEATLYNKFKVNLNALGVNFPIIYRITFLFLLLSGLGLAAKVNGRFKYCDTFHNLKPINMKQLCSFDIQDKPEHVFINTRSSPLELGVLEN